MATHGIIYIDPHYCKGCALCLPACPKGGMGIALDRLTPKGYHPAYLINPDACTGCALCAVVCPDAAITVFRDAPRRKHARAA